MIIKKFLKVFCNPEQHRNSIINYSLQSYNGAKMSASLGVYEIILWFAAVGEGRKRVNAPVAAINRRDIDEERRQSLQMFN